MQIQNNLITPLINNNKLKIGFKNISSPSFTGNIKIDIFESNFTKDPDLQTLDQLVKKYRESGDINDKSKLFDQEQKILFQELTEPEKYLERAKRMHAMEDIPKDHKDQITQLKINALYGIVAHYATLKDLKLPQKDVDSVIPVVKKIIEEASGDSELDQKLKLYALYPISPIYKSLSPESKTQADNLLLDVLKNSTSEDCRKRSFGILSNKINKDKPFYKELQNIAYEHWSSKDSTPEKKRSALINLAVVYSPHLKTIIPKLLRDEKTDISLKIASAWCAGRVKTEDNFKILSEIVNSSDKEPDHIKLKEMALSSLALYIKNHPKEDREIMEKVSKSDSELKESASVLLKKLLGKGYIKDALINQTIFNEKEIEHYKKLRATYIEGIDKLNTKQKNRVDEALLPFEKVLENLTKFKSKFIITDDSVTKIIKSSIGKRTGDGRFDDSVDGMAYNNNIALSNWCFNEPDNAVAHEFNHVFLFNVLDSQDERKLKNLYTNAIKENRCIDFYAARDYAEYFAQGYQSYVANYVPQKQMINNGDYYKALNTRISLKSKDPDLYNFIEFCIEKYKDLYTKH